MRANYWSYCEGKIAKLSITFMIITPTPCTGSVSYTHLDVYKRQLDELAQALQDLYGSDLKAIYNKSADTLPDEFAKTTPNGYVFGGCPVPHPVKENGHTFLIDWETGQKTGFFLDPVSYTHLWRRAAAILCRGRASCG